MGRGFVVSVFSGGSVGFSRGGVWSLAAAAAALFGGTAEAAPQFGYPYYQYYYSPYQPQIYRRSRRRRPLRRAASPA